MQMNAVANAPRTLVNFLTRPQFRARGQAQATIQKMWQDWTEDLERKGEHDRGRLGRRHRRLLPQNPWARGFMLGRKLDEVERLNDYTWYVLNPRQSRVTSTTIS